MADLRTQVRDAIAQALGYSAYDCTRVWDGWDVGTMDRDDFALIVEDESRLVEIADAALLAPTERIGRLEDQVAALLVAVKAQHKIIDQMLVMLIESDASFMPTKSPIWPLIVAVGAPALIAAAEVSRG